MTALVTVLASSIHTLKEIYQRFCLGPIITRCLIFLQESWRGYFSHQDVVSHKRLLATNLVHSTYACVTCWNLLFVLVPRCVLHEVQRPPCQLTHNTTFEDLNNPTYLVNDPSQWIFYLSVTKDTISLISRPTPLESFSLDDRQNSLQTNKSCQEIVKASYQTIRFNSSSYKVCHLCSILIQNALPTLHLGPMACMICFQFCMSFVDLFIDTILDVVNHTSYREAYKRGYQQQRNCHLCLR